MDNEKACIVCGPVTGAASLGHTETCAQCKVPVWVSQTAIDSVLEKGVLIHNIHYCCHDCVKDIKFTEVMPINKAQLAELAKEGVPESVLKKLADSDSIKEFMNEQIARDKHVAWVKERALQETTLPNMIASFISDLHKDETTRPDAMFAMITTPLFKSWDIEKFKSFVKKFK